MSGIDVQKELAFSAAERSPRRYCQEIDTPVFDRRKFGQEEVVVRGEVAPISPFFGPENHSCDGAGGAVLGHLH